MKYIDLITYYPLRPIADGEDFKKRGRLLNTLLDEPDLDTACRWYLDVLTLIIEDYEKANFPLPDVPPREMLKHLMEQKSMTQAKLAREMSVSPGLVCDLLKGRANFTLRRIHQIAAIFGESPSIFV